MPAYIVFIREKTLDQSELETYWSKIRATMEGRPIKVRFLWIKQGPDHAHWEQAFSLDGKAWEVNWVNELTRAEPSKICNGVRPRS